MNKKLFSCLNVCLPLTIGLLIYIFFHKTTYINIFFDEYLSLNFTYINENNIFITIIKNWACDFLWAYSLFFALAIILTPFKSKIKLSVILSASISIYLEILQYAHVIAGTFDWCDIFFEIAAITFAVNIIKRSFYL